MAIEYAHENIWFDKWRADDAEREFYEKKSSMKEQSEVEASGCDTLSIPLAEKPQVTQDISEKAPEGGRSGPAGGASPDVLNRITKLEGENASLTKRVSSLEQTILNLAKQMESLSTGKTTTTPAPQKKLVEEDEDDDDEVDLFGSDDEEEDDDAARVREERLKAYADKKSKKPGPIAKSSVLIDCKPWDDETDMKAMENEIRKIEMDGLIWGAAKLVPLAYGIQKLSLLCTVEDEKVSIDDLCEKIEEIEDYVQSTDIAAFNKI